MRFLSKFGQFALQVRGEERENYASGASKVTQMQVIAKFEPGGCNSEERELAIRRWRFNGQLQEMDEVTSIQPDYRIGLFDSVIAQSDSQWPDELRKEVERKLIDHSERFEDVMLVPHIGPEPPWPRYDAYNGTPAQLLRKLTDEGHDLHQVLAYERENQNRERVVEAISSLLDDPAALAELQPREEEVVG
jgi:hypothetical protein